LINAVAPAIAPVIGFEQLFEQGRRVARTREVDDLRVEQDRHVRIVRDRTTLRELKCLHTAADHGGARLSDRWAMAGHAFIGPLDRFGDEHGRTPRRTTIKTAGWRGSSICAGITWRLDATDAAPERRR